MSRIAAWSWGSLLGLALWLAGGPAAAQAPVAGPAGRVAGTAEVLQRLFGPETAEEEKALAGVNISPEEEEELGRQAVGAYLDYLKQQRIRVVSRGRDVEYLRRLVERIHPRMEHAAKYRRFTIYIAETPRVNARSFPNGTLVFLRGLMDAVQSEAALVGVIGHELSHLDHGHLLTRLRRMKLARQSMAEGRRPQSPEQLLDGVTNMTRLWTRPFRQEDELAADRDGARWAYQAGYDPRELRRVIAKLGEQESPLLALVPAFLHSHPPAADREKAIEALYEELQRQSPRADLILGRENLRRRSPHQGAGG